MLKWPTLGQPRRQAGFSAPSIPFDGLAVRAALDRLLDAGTSSFEPADAALILRSIPCEPTDRKSLTIEYEPFSFGTRSQLATEGPNHHGASDDDEPEEELAELRIGGPRTTYRVSQYVLFHVPGALRIRRAEQSGKEEFRAELRYTPGTDQLTGLYRDIPSEFKLMHIRIIRFRARLWKLPI